MQDVGAYQRHCKGLYEEGKRKLPDSAQEAANNRPEVKANSSQTLQKAEARCSDDNRHSSHRSSTHHKPAKLELSIEGPEAGQASQTEAQPNIGDWDIQPLHYRTNSTYTVLHLPSHQCSRAYEAQPAIVCQTNGCGQDSHRQCSGRGQRYKGHKHNQVAKHLNHLARQCHMEHLTHTRWKRTKGRGTDGKYTIEMFPLPNSTIIQQGLHPHPGPTDLPHQPLNFDDSPKDFILDFVNVTSLLPAADTVMRRRSHLVAIAEHRITGDKLREMQAKASKKRWNWQGTGTDPTKMIPTGGTGVLHLGKTPVVAIKPTTDAMKVNWADGRACQYWVDIGHGPHLLLTVIYGVPNSNTVADNRHITEAMIAGFFEEAERFPEHPHIIIGDLNADPHRIKPLRDKLHSGECSDLGRIADRWDRQPLEPTCNQAGAKKATRIDLAFTNGLALPLIQDFKVQHADEYPTHQVLQLRINAGGLYQGGWKADIKPCLADLFEQKVKERYQEAVQEDAQLKECKFREEQKTLLQERIDRSLAKHRGQLESAKAQWDTTALWRRLCRAIEEAFTSYLEFPHEDKARMRAISGRGRVRILKATPPRLPDKETPSTSKAPLSAAGHRARRQARRLGHIASRLRLLTIGRVYTDDDGRQAFTECSQVARNRNILINVEAIAAVKRRIDHDDPKQVSFLRFLDDPECSTSARHWSAVKRAQTCFENKAQEDLAKQAGLDRADWQTQAKDPTHGMAVIARALKPLPAKPLTSVADPKSKRKGMVATIPKEVDKIVRDAWKEVYQGNFANADEQTAAFIHKYRPQLFSDYEHPIGPITAEALHHNCKTASKSVGGLDSWTPSDFSLLIVTACQELADLLNLI